MTPELFEAITQWQQEKFPDATDYEYGCKLKEEVEEAQDEISYNPVKKDKLRDELADIAIVFFGLIDRSGFTHHDITEAIANKFAIIRNQEFVFDKKTGVHRRVKV